MKKIRFIKNSIKQPAVDLLLPVPLQISQKRVHYPRQGEKYNRFSVEDL